MENQEHIHKLIHRYRQGSATEEEVRDLLRQVQSAANGELLETIIADGLLDEPPGWMKQSTEVRQKLDVVFGLIEQHRQTVVSHKQAKRSIRKWWLPVSAAAAAIITFTIGWIFFADQPQPTPEDILPGANRATLTLANGQIIGLSEAHTGIVVGDEITYLDGTKVSTISGQTSRLMTLSTPKGGTYQITLPDGTKVWLNAASTLKYPDRFDDKERVVRLEGEAYFEVEGAKYAGAWPFKIVSENQTIEVLGTSFNVNAYADERSITTTLVSGSLRVTLNQDVTGDGVTSLILKPGEESVFTAGQLEKRPADLNASTAWKDGYFVFNHATIETIAGQIGRWYGINVDCVNLPHQTFSAEIPRNVKLSTLLKLIESTSDLQCELIDDPDDPKGERRLMITQ